MINKSTQTNEYKHHVGFIRPLNNNNKRMKRTFLIVILVASVLNSVAQDSLLLPVILRSLKLNHELVKVNASTDSIYALKVSNIRTTYLPSLNFNSELMWQSDVTSVKIDVPGIQIPTPDKDSYRFTIDVGQVVWDGGSTIIRVRNEENTRLVERHKVEVEMYAMTEKVVELFYAVGSLNIAMEQIVVMQNELNKRIDEIGAGVRAGAVLESAVMGLKAELLRLDQSIASNVQQRNSLIDMINAIAGTSLSYNAHFIKPNLITPQGTQSNRPEIQMFNLQKNLIESSIKLLKFRRMPVFGAFGRLGYGKPGLNMLSNKFDFYGIMGFQVTWNIWDWSNTARIRQMMRIEQNMLDYRREAYESTANSQVKSILSKIELINKQIEKDGKIVELMEGSVQIAASQLRNGTITSATYLSEMNGLLRARIDRELRLLKLSYEEANLYIALGDDLIDCKQ